MAQLYKLEDYKWVAVNFEKEGGGGGNVSLLLPISLSPSAFSLPKKAKFFFVHVFEIYSAFASDSQINHSSLYLPTVQHNWTTMKDAIQVRGRTWS